MTNMVRSPTKNAAITATLIAVCVYLMLMSEGYIIASVVVVWGVVMRILTIDEKVDRLLKMLEDKE